MAVNPCNLLQTLVDKAMDLCRAGTAGISDVDDRYRRRVPRLGSPLRRVCPYIRSRTPRYFSPCGTTLDRNAPQLFSHPGSLFHVFRPGRCAHRRGLGHPRIRQWPATARWIIAHDETHHFDVEDVGLMTSLTAFASAGLQVVFVLEMKTASAAPSNSLRRMVPRSPTTHAGWPWHS